LEKLTPTRAFAWTGGAVFVASLAACAWRYFVALGRVEGGGGAAAFAIDAALVTAFALHHSLFARAGLKRRIAQRLGALERSAYVWVASLLFIAVCALWEPIGGSVYRASGLVVAALAGVQVLGLWLIARAVAGLDPLELAGIRQTLSTPAKREPLQTGGPYGLVRHPLYLGWVVMLFGTPHMTIDRLAFAALTSAYLVIAVPWEERALLKSFGDDYARYRRRVRWRIVPFVY
jgi:methanethiol S-methyltransferase